MRFNIFTTLSKDNKELTHSAFLKFLLTEDKFFGMALIDIEHAFKNEDIMLEKKLSKKLRADLLIENKVANIIVENKFKCLPYRKQLEDYSDKLRGKNYSKYLLYFSEGSNFNIPADWRPITYHQVNDAIKEYLRINNLPEDKKVFLEHYQSFLQDYIEAYESLKDNYNLYNLFKGKFQYNGINEPRFWLNLIFHELSSKLSGTYDKIFVGGGSTYKPFLNIHVPAWDFKNSLGYEFVAQLNGSDLKFYAHLRDEKNRQEVIDQELKLLKSSSFKSVKSGKFKNKLSLKSKTGYIYKENITSEIDAANFTLDNIQSYIDNFINRIEEARIP